MKITSADSDGKESQVLKQRNKFEIKAKNLIYYLFGALIGFIVYILQKINSP